MESTETHFNYYSRDTSFKTLKSSNNFVNYSSDDSIESPRSSEYERPPVGCITSSSETEEKGYYSRDDKNKSKDYSRYVKSKVDILREYPRVRRNRNEENTFTINTISVGKYVTEIYGGIEEKRQLAMKRSTHCTKTNRSITANCNKKCNAKRKRKRKVKKRPKWKFDKLPIQDSSTSGRCKELDSSEGYPGYFETYGSTNPFSRYYYSEDPNAYIESVQRRLAQKSVIVNTAHYSTGAVNTCIDSKSNSDDKMKDKDNVPSTESDPKLREEVNPSQSSSGYTSTQPLGQDQRAYSKSSAECKSPPECCARLPEWYDPFKRPVITATCVLERRRVSDIKTRAKRDENIQPNVVYYEMMPHPLNQCQELEVSYPVLCSTCDNNCKM